MGKKVLLSISMLLLFGLFFFIAGDALALTINQPANTGVQSTGSGDTQLQTIIAAVIRVLIISGAILFIILLLWGAISWITSGGDKDKLKAARSKIVNAIIGFALLALTFAIASLIGSIVGFNPLADFPLPRLGDSDSRCPQGYIWWESTRSCRPTTF